LPSDDLKPNRSSAYHEKARKHNEQALRVKSLRLLHWVPVGGWVGWGGVAYKAQWPDIQLKHENTINDKLSLCICGRPIKHWLFCLN